MQVSPLARQPQTSGGPDRHSSPPSAIAAASFEAVMQSQIADGVQTSARPAEIKRMVKGADQMSDETLSAQLRKVVEDRRALKAELEEKLQERKDMLDAVKAQLSAATGSERARLAGLAQVLQRHINELTQQIQGIDEEINATAIVLDALQAGEPDPVRPVMDLVGGHGLGPPS